MRKIQIALIGTFMAGVLLTGVGVGVAMIEYSSFEYGGEKWLGGETVVSKTLEFQLPEADGVIVLGEKQRYDLGQVMEVVETPEVPVGILQYEIAYNDSLVEPYLYFEEAGVTAEQETIPQSEFTNLKESGKAEPEPITYAGFLDVHLEYCGDEFKTFMKTKDIILKELKERRISSYDTVHVTGITVKVNPETMPRLKTHQVVY